MNWKNLLIGIAISLVFILSSSGAAIAGKKSSEPTAQLFVTGLEQYLTGSTIGPDGALYIPEGVAGKVSRVDLKTREVTTFASGLPKAVLVDDIGGPADIAFINGTAYVLVILVASDLGGSDIVGIYRLDGPDSYTIIADLGAWSTSHPPETDFFVPTGNPYAMQPYKGGFLVTDAHHNRVLWVSLSGKITELVAFENIVPTGLDLWGNRIYMAEAGPIPHLPETGKVMTFGPKSFTPKEVASGARLLVDVEFGPGRTLFALSQGFWDGPFEGSPAQPNTGSLQKVNEDGSFTVLVEGLDRPTSLEIIGQTAYVITLDGEVWKIKNISAGD